MCGLRTAAARLPNPTAKHDQNLHHLRGGLCVAPIGKKSHLFPRLPLHPGGTGSQDSKAHMEPGGQSPAGR